VKENKKYTMNSGGYKLLKDLPDLLSTFNSSPDSKELKSKIIEFVELGFEKPFFRSIFYPFSRDDQKVIESIIDLIDELVYDKMISIGSIDHIQEKLEEMKEK